MGASTVSWCSTPAWDSCAAPSVLTVEPLAILGFKIFGYLFYCTSPTSLLWWPMVARHWSGCALWFGRVLTLPSCLVGAGQLRPAWQFFVVKIWL
jgi:hypothetical protein